MLHDINLFRISKAVDLFCPEISYYVDINRLRNIRNTISPDYRDAAFHKKYQILEAKHKIYKLATQAERRPDPMCVYPMCVYPFSREGGINPFWGSQGFYSFKQS